MTQVEGFIIAGPNGAEGGYHTFGRTMTEAWTRHIGRREDEGEAATLRSRWAQKGWRPVPATLHIKEQ